MHQAVNQSSPWGSAEGDGGKSLQAQLSFSFLDRLLNNTLCKR